jgi:SAM-dependent methyltransferase
MTAMTIDGHRAQGWPSLPDREHGPRHHAVLAALGPLDGRRLLDAGCGVGLFLCAAERRGALVAGTDTAVERLEIARWALPDADLRVTEPGDALPFDSGTFDTVVALGGTVAVPELVRVCRPGGMVTVGGWTRPAWAETFASHLGGLAPATRVPVAGLTVCATGEVDFPARYPSVGTAWTAMLGSEDVLCATRLAGDAPVRAAFAAAVAGAVAADGAVCLPRTFRYTVATTR